MVKAWHVLRLLVYVIDIWCLTSVPLQYSVSYECCFFLFVVQSKETVAVLCDYRNFYFKPQSLEHHELGGHCTTGVDLLVTSNRVILLDTQPMLSASVMDRLVQQENKKFTGTDFASTENAMEIQSLQLAAFLLSVCHVVILVQDWFFDPNLVRCDTTIKLLKPFIYVWLLLATEKLVYLYTYTSILFSCICCLSD